MACEMDMDPSNGKMVPITKECGKTIELMAKESYSMLMEISTKANGLTTKQKAQVHIRMKTEPNTKVNG